MFSHPHSSPWPFYPPPPSDSWGVLWIRSPWYATAAGQQCVCAVMSGINPILPSPTTCVLSWLAYVSYSCDCRKRLPTSLPPPHHVLCPSHTGAKLGIVVFFPDPPSFSFSSQKKKEHSNYRVYMEPWIPITVYPDDKTRWKWSI